jgi:hypothetical protein
MAALGACTALLQMCAAGGMLKTSGKLVLFVPIQPECEDVVPYLPQHSAMQLDSAIKQPLNSRICRWLLTYTKLRDATADETIQRPSAAAVLDTGLGYRLPVSSIELEQPLQLAQ